MMGDYRLVTGRRKQLEERIEVLEHEVDMWRKHVPELEATIKELEQDALCFDYMKLKKRIAELEAALEDK